MTKIKKIIITTLASIVGVFVILFAVVAIMWRNEISSIMSIEMLVDGSNAEHGAPVYKMDVKGGYYFDEFIEQGGVSSDQELINFIVGNLTKGIIPISLEAPTIGCSSFTAQGSDGTRYFGRNYDFSKTTAMIVETNPGNGRYRSISSVDLQFLGLTDGQKIEGIMDKVISLASVYVPLDGINEKGVSCGIYMTYQGPSDNVVSTDQQTERPDITSTTMLRMVLDYADSVDKAIELIQKYDLHDSASTSFHYMIADSTGKSAIVEWINGTDKTDTDGSKRELKVIYNNDDAYVGEKEGQNDFQYVTNFIVSPNYYEDDSEKGGFDRYNKIEEMINPNGTNTSGVITKQQGLDILETVGRRKWDANNGASDSNSITVWSCLYDLTNKTVNWVSNEQFHDSSSVFSFSL